MEIVTIHNLKKYFGKGARLVKALDGISLSIEKHKFTAITGASGSGMEWCGLLKPHSYIS